MAREVKVAILGDSREFARAARDTQADVNRLGSSFSQLASDVDKVGAPTRRAFDDTTAAVRRTGDETDRTRGVFANFAGNAVQDVPGIAGSFGALNVAAGQFAEYASEGDIKLGNMVKALGPMLLLGAAIQGISKSLERAAAARAFEKDKIREWAAEIRDGATATEILRGELEETGQVNFRIFNDTANDAAPVLAELGLTVENFTRLVEGSNDQLHAWANAQRAAGADAEAVAIAVAAASDNHDRLTQAQESAAVTAQLLGTAEEQTTEDMREAADVAGDHQAAIDGLRESMSEYIEEAFASQDATAGWLDALHDLRLAIDENGASLDLNTERGRENFQAGREVAEGLAALMQARFDETGSLQSSIDAGNLYVEQLRNQLSQAGLTQEQVKSYIDTLHLTPSNIATNFVANTAEAVEQVQELQRALQGIAPGQYNITPNLTINGARAAGGPVIGGGAYLVGEEGPEVFVPGSSGYIVPNGGSPTGMGGGPMQVQVFLDSQVLVDALVSNERRNGPIPIRVAG